ncbi:hypothetical protein BVV20_21610 [Xanthomonas oryzae pv. oryzae]|nr:hypothetical protein BVV20_21610 [Xanthomonas oryzae pv. oryzae]
MQQVPSPAVAGDQDIKRLKNHCMAARPSVAAAWRLYNPALVLLRAISISLMTTRLTPHAAL